VGLVSSALFVLALALFVLLLPLLSIAGTYLASFMPFNDFYTKILLLSYKSLLFSRTRPVAKEFRVTDLRPKRRLSVVPIAYALDIAIPKGAEEEFSPETTPSFTSRLSVWIEENLYRLPYFVNNQRFGPNEDPVQFAMAAVGDAYPEVNTLYNKGKLTDEGLTQMCFYGLGAHRLFRETMPTTPDEAASGDWVVRTNFLADLPVRDGLDSYGGDCYFDAETWRVTKIIRRRPNARAFDPPDEQQDTYTPEHKDWEYIKFVFRSSLFSLVTLVDHLYAIHLQVGNVVTIAAREELSPEHPIRRFLVPYSYQTISVNDNARNNLINPRSMGPRNFAFTDQGTALAWAAAPSLFPSGPELRKAFHNDHTGYLTILVDFEQYLTFLSKNGMNTPYRVQALEYWRITKRFVVAFLKQYYPTPGDLAADVEARRFVQSSFEQMQMTDHDALPELSADHLWFFTTNLITRFCYLVTAGHEHVGTVPVYAQDVSFTAFQWPKGTTCGTKQTAITSATLMAFTSLPMPMLLTEPGSGGDWTHLFLGPLQISGRKVGQLGIVPTAVRTAFANYQRELKYMARQCDAFNEQALGSDYAGTPVDVSAIDESMLPRTLRELCASCQRAARSEPGSFPHCFGMWQTNPKFLETAVSV